VLTGIFPFYVVLCISYLVLSRGKGVEEYEDEEEDSLLGSWKADLPEELTHSFASFILSCCSPTVYEGQHPGLMGQSFLYFIGKI
jgi:hypothetical protein